MRFTGKNRNEVNITEVVQRLYPTSIAVKFIVRADSLKEATQIAEVITSRRKDRALPEGPYFASTD